MVSRDMTTGQAGEAEAAPKGGMAQPAGLPQLSPQAIEETVQQIALLQDLVHRVFKRNRDYGRTPGTKEDSLWNPGAAIIRSAFRCHPGRRRLLSLRDDEERLAVVVEVPLMSLITGQEMGSGIGAASTMETRYRYRWLSEAEVRQLGFEAADLGAFRRRQKETGAADSGRTGEWEYRVPNPEHSELLNTIIKLASKRAEVDAAETLPGVSSALRELFQPQKGDEAPAARGAARPGKAPAGDITLPRFWGEMERLGVDEEQVHALLGVNSVTTWVRQGRSLQEAVESIRQAIAQPPEAPEAPAEPGEECGESESQAGFRNWGEVASAVRELGVKTEKVFTEAAARLGKKVERWPDMGRDYYFAWNIAREIARRRQTA